MKVSIGEIMADVQEDPIAIIEDIWVEIRGRRVPLDDDFINQLLHRFELDAIELAKDTSYEIEMEKKWDTMR